MEEKYPDCSAGRRTPAKGVILSEDMPLILFATVCTKDRGTWLAQDDVRATLHDIWLQDATGWLVGPYVIMPDHLHFLCVPQHLNDGIEMERWVAFWKDRFSKRIKNPLWRWQRGVFYHRMRHDGHVNETVVYMQQNPVKKGLVATAEAWPWRGNVHDIAHLPEGWQGQQTGENP